MNVIRVPLTSVTAKSDLAFKISLSDPLREVLLETGAAISNEEMSEVIAGAQEQFEDELDEVVVNITRAVEKAAVQLMRQKLAEAGSDVVISDEGTEEVLTIIEELKRQ